MISPNWRHLRFAVVDVEGNGQSPPEIIEIAIVPVAYGAVSSLAFHSLVKPQQHIRSRVTRFHGLRDADVAEAPSLQDISVDVLRALESDYMVAHNAPVERNILSRSLPMWKPKGVLDTLRLAKRLLPERTSYSLSSLAKDCSIDVAGTDNTGVAHRAAYDALVTAHLLVHLLTLAETARMDVFTAADRGASLDAPEQGTLF